MTAESFVVGIFYIILVLCAVLLLVLLIYLGVSVVKDFIDDLKNDRRRKEK